MTIVSPLGLFKNPMILLSVVALGITVGMPKLLENSMPSFCLLHLPVSLHFVAASCLGLCQC